MRILRHRDTNFETETIKTVNFSFSVDLPNIMTVKRYVKELDKCEKVLFKNTVLWNIFCSLQEKAEMTFLFTDVINNNDVFKNI